MGLTFSDSIRSKLDLAHAGKPALVGAAALLVMVAVFAGRMLIDTATATDIHLHRSSESTYVESAESEIQKGSSEASGKEAQDAKTASQPSDSSDVIYVHVSGAVNRPGLVKLSVEARIADAVDAAGGAADNARLESVNLAQKLADGEHVHVSSLDEDAPYEVIGNSEAPVTTENQSAKLNINTATEAELQSLPGIGPSTAKKIIEDRNSAGPYVSTEDIMRVPGIGEKKYSSIADLICI